jgi:hypothetical protein
VFGDQLLGGLAVETISRHFVAINFPHVPGPYPRTAPLPPTPGMPYLHIRMQRAYGTVHASAHTVAYSGQRSVIGGQCSKANTCPKKRWAGSKVPAASKAHRASPPALKRREGSVLST